MKLTANDITIAITVFDRREFLRESINSALNQTVPVRVMVVEDCGPDAGLETFVKNEFGSRVEYVRSPSRRGIFGNWNFCIEICTTPWLSILHDDDYLMPEFVAVMLALHQQAGNRGLYFGQTRVVNDDGRSIPSWQKAPLPAPWLPVELKDILFTSPFSFPGQLLRVEHARALGVFRETSLFCGDWELWAKLIAHHGGAQADATVAVFREHGGWERGSHRVFRSGKTYGLIAVQQKRNVALARQVGLTARFDRCERLKSAPMPTRYVLKYGAGFSPRMLRYNVGLYFRSTPPHLAYRFVQTLIRFFGPQFARMLSKFWNVLR